MCQIPITFLLIIINLYQLHAQDEIPGYMVVRAKYCELQHETGGAGKTLQQCAMWCDNLAGCVSFEFFTKRSEGGTLCQPSTTCSLATSATYPYEDQNGPLYFYSVIGDIPGYTVVPKKYCYSQNEGGEFYGKTLQECVSACNNLENCVSFEYFPNRGGGGTLCQPSTTCTLATSSTYTQESTHGPIYFFSVDPVGTRDCSVLAIDEFLLQCSAEFSTQTSAITDLDTLITALETDLNQQISINSANITQLQTDLANGNAGATTQITDLQQELTDVNTRLDLFAAKSETGMFDASFANDTNISGIALKDLLIILLLGFNLIAMFCVGCYKNRNEIKKKHYSIPYDEESDAIDVEQE